MLYRGKRSNVAPSRTSLLVWCMICARLHSACSLRASSSFTFPVIPKNSKVGALLFVKPRATGSQRSRSSSLLNKSRSIKPEAEIGVVKEKIVKGRMAENESVGNNSDSFERMTVQELRKKLRSIGVSANGCKRDLVSALKSYTNSQVDGEDPQLVVEDELFSKVNSIHCENNSKRKAKSLFSMDHADTMNTVSEVSGRVQIKRRAKQTPTKGEDFFMVAEDQISSKFISIRSEKKAKGNAKSLFNEVAGKKPTCVKKEEPSVLISGDIRASDRIDISEHQIEPWTVLTHKKPQKGWIPYNPRTMRRPPLSGDIKNVKLMSWNVNGLRALLKLEGFSALELAQREDFDVLCLQETKLQEKDVEAIKQSLLEGYENSFWTCSVSKLGYSGTAIISRIAPRSVRYGLGISDHDSEGRLVTTEFDSFYLLSGYVPNSGDGLRRLSYRVTQWDPSLSSYMKELEKSKPVILTGDLNCAHEEIDIYNPAGNKKSAGFTIEERMSFETNFLNKGFVDTFRKQHPGVVGYTYWGYRHGGRKSNKGWRLDYFLVSESIADNVHDSYILPDVTGSDHSPIGLILKL